MQSPPPGSSAPAGHSAIPSTELHALLGRGTSFRGKISFSGRIRIDGQFEGEILGGDVLVIGDGADVRGTIRADSVIIRGGVVDAEIVAPRSVELYVPAQVSGTLHSPEIHLDRGVQFTGTCDMTPVED